MSGAQARMGDGEPPGRSRPSAGAVRALAALILAASSGSAAADAGGLDEPIPWQDAGRMAVPFLQLPFESPRILEPGQLAVSLRTFYASNIADGQSASLAVDYATETAEATAVIRWGLDPRLELHLEVPGVVDQAGFLNGTIKAVESVFGGVNPLRYGAPPLAARFRLARPNGPAVSWRGTHVGVGDVWGGAKIFVRDQQAIAPSLAVRVALKLPLARFPWGSGAPEIGGGVLAGWKMGRTSLFVAADLSVPTHSVSVLHLATMPHPAFQLGVSRALSSRFALDLQMSVHGSALADVGLKEVSGWTSYLLAGVRARAMRSWFVDFALVENLFDNQAGADFTGVLVLDWNPP